MERRSIALVGTMAVFALVVASSGCQQTAPGAEGEGAGTGQDFGTDTGDIDEVSPIELTDMQTIYFDFDKSTIRADQRANLQTDADYIKARPGNDVITLQGSCDERGSEEYNLALGERRAAAVKQYLEDLGVPAARMRTVSFGESKPSVAGHDESAWKWNRRVDFAIYR